MIRIAKSAPLTRPADTTAYASGDLVANSTTAADVTPFSFTVSTLNGGKGVIRRVRLRKSDGTDVANAAFRVHLYRDAPTVTNGDNGVWLSTESEHLGSFDVTVDKAFSDGAKGSGIPIIGTGVQFQAPASKKRLYALLEARGAYTPASAEVFILTLEIEEEEPPPAR